jgi:Tol biopolymer transport system component
MPSFRDLVRSLPLVIAAAVPACNGDDLVEPSTGTLEITTVTAGAELDPDGYTVQVDAEPIRTIGVQGQLSAEAATGDHSIRLDGVANHCVVEGENPRTVALASGATTPVAFSVTCHSTTGTLVVTSSSSGFFPDPDGYLITVDGAAGVAIGGSDQQILSNLSTGVHQIGLAGLIANCRVQGQNPRSQEIVGGGETLVAFEVECAPPAIAFRSTRSDNRSSIYLINPDGSGLVRFPSTNDERSPVWSPDGRRLAYVGGPGDLYVMTPGAGDRTRLFQSSSGGEGGASVRMPRWSPDGTAIAFWEEVVLLCDGVPCIGRRVWIVQADGTGLRKLADGSAPVWSPDGRTIVFGNDQGIATIAPDGGGLKQFTVPMQNQPEEATWSPDGSRLAFSAFVSSNPYANAIFTINRDGTGLVRLTPEWGSETGPQWSPDGSRIAFRAELSGPDDPSTGLGVMNADGSGRSIVSDLEIKNLDFTWSPDGGRLAFTVRTDFEIGDDDVYVVNVDGSGLRNLTRNPRADMQPSWGFR